MVQSESTLLPSAKGLGVGHSPTTIETGIGGWSITPFFLWSLNIVETV